MKIGTPPIFFSSSTLAKTHTMNDLATRVHDSFLPMTKAKLTFWTGVICTLVALFLILTPITPLRFEVPTWSVATVFAVLASISVLFHEHTPLSQIGEFGTDTKCAHIIRQKGVVLAVAFGLLAFMLMPYWKQPLHIKVKYEDFTVSLCPEIILVVVAATCWNLLSK